jgi:C-terminal processing protease CtpA/Prc
VINSLELNRVFVITTSETASASELLINGLAPYIEVIHVGEQTVGKNVGSITVYDYIDTEQTINPNHNYAMQPIVFKIENSEGFVDYSSGLEPNYLIKESLENMGILGNEEEPMLKIVLGIINGTQKLDIFDKSLDSPKMIHFDNPMLFKKQKMYTNKEFF